MAGAINLGADGGGHARTGCEVFGKLGVPCSCGFRHRSLGCHALLDRPPAIITLVGLHWVPPYSALPEEHHAKLLKTK